MKRQQFVSRKVGSVCVRNGNNLSVERWGRPVSEMATNRH